MSAPASRHPKAPTHPAGTRRAQVRPWRAVLAAWFAVLLLAIAGPGPARAAVSPEWAERWREDLVFLEKTLPATHADLFHAMPRDSFAARLERLRSAVPRMTHAEIVVAIADLVAGVRDGHTRLSLPVDPAAGFFSGHSSTSAPKIDGLLFHHLPVRLYLYEDGLFVRRIGKPHARAVGGRVLRIGRMSADEAMQAVSPIVQRDNASQLRHLLPDFLVVPEVLAARGVIASANTATFEVETPRGDRMTLTLDAVPTGAAVEWVDVRDAAPAQPLYRRHPDLRYWFEYLPEDRIVYMQYNEVYDRKDESLEAFAGRMFGFVDAHPVAALVIDIRGNPGGNNSRNMSLLKGLIRSAKLQAPGHLFVLAGRGTFSAAMMFALDVEKYTNAIFVGEPTGARPNHYGDSRKVTLPNSGLTVRVSTLYWQYSDPRDDRDAITPQIPEALTSADDRAGRDPALDAVRAIVAGPPSAPRLAGEIAGRIYARPGAYDFTLAMNDSAATPTLSIPDFGLDALPMERLSTSTDRLSFDVPLDDRTMRIEGRWMGGWLIGAVTVPENGTFMMLIPPR